MTIPESHLAQEAVAALVDGELPSGPAGRAARHLAGCSMCRMAVQAQREAKDALHGSGDVAVPSDLLSRLRAIPFTADVPGGGLGGLAAGSGELTFGGGTASWSVPLEPHRPGVHPDQARWLRRGVAGAFGVGLGMVALALSLSGNGSTGPTSNPAVARPAPQHQHTSVIPPVVRTVRTSSLNGTAPDGTP